ncbi:hypothetical protein HanXRQr2_Chr02g0076321 [Helianthus annuus]|uniref:Uncharacterized protein n=1 Tax=Helianthus annuus TaxID=4232 RepID=A0A9K3NZP8_HELAN|nr:hypothetical protein HanXRQr2_Chr02g0076321 [Helianthus annuus]
MSMQKTHHYQKTPAPDISLNELATSTTFSFRDVRFLRHDHSELKDSCSTAH